jgi:hypothetical protein
VAKKDYSTRRQERWLRKRKDGRIRAQEAMIEFERTNKMVVEVGQIFYRVLGRR